MSSELEKHAQCQYAICIKEQTESNSAMDEKGC